VRRPPASVPAALTKETGVTSTIKMVDSGDDNLKHGQRTVPVGDSHERGQQILPGSRNPRAGQDTSKLIVPEMPLPPQPPAEDD
jgi:hypothetical protein